MAPSSRSTDAAADENCVVLTSRSMATWKEVSLFFPPSRPFPPFQIEFFFSFFFICDLAQPPSVSATSFSVIIRPPHPHPRPPLHLHVDTSLIAAFCSAGDSCHGRFSDALVLPGGDNRRHKGAGGRGGGRRATLFLKTLHVAHVVLWRQSFFFVAASSSGPSKKKN